MAGTMKWRATPSRSTFTRCERNSPTASSATSAAWATCWPRRRRRLSIRNRLLLWLLSALLILTALITAVAYVVERTALREHENERLKRIALAIPANLKKADLRQINVKLHHGRDDFALQIWDSGSMLIYFSHADFALSGLSPPGFS